MREWRKWKFSLQVLPAFLLCFLVVFDKEADNNNHHQSAVNVRDVTELYCSIPSLSNPSLVIANGGGGQTGVIEFLANLFFNTPNGKSNSNTCIGWNASNTHGSHEALRTGYADIAIVYDTARISDAILSNEAIDWIVQVWMDRLLILGPKSNPASIHPNDTIQTALKRIMYSENSYWMSRVDESTVNLKEAHLVAVIVTKKRQNHGLASLDKSTLIDLLKYQGMMSLAKEYQRDAHLHLSKDVDFDLMKQLEQVDMESPNYKDFLKECRYGFYRPHFLLPAQAAIKVNKLDGYYLLSDYGIHLSSRPEDKGNVKIVLDGYRQDQEAFYLNPAFAIKGTKSASPYTDMFMEFMNDKTTNAAIPNFKGRQNSQTRSFFDSPYEFYDRKANESIVEFVDRLPSIYWDDT